MKISTAKFATLLATMLAGLALVASSARPQSADDRSWTDKHFTAAFDEFFPIEHAEGDFIAVRVHRDGVNDVPEFSVVLEDTEKPRVIRGILREAQGAPLYQQLLALHAKDPSRPYEQLKQDLKIQEWKFSAAQCPAVATQLQAFNNIQFVRPRDDDAEEEHPILYQFHESVGGGDSEVMEFVESRAFPKWANETRKALDACVGSVSRANGK
ncbi:MAG: hypothetical protein P4L00_11530 [Candidatus Acidoferrales bacterium]|nr:hypothetical protein [Candidatus Acidoferrales bacterium]